MLTLDTYAPYGYNERHPTGSYSMTKVTLHIEGMTCSHCLNAVSRALNAVPGAVVESVQMGRAEVEVPTASDSEKLVAAVSDAGYPATVQSQA